MSGRNVFITGGGGTGKSFILQTVISALRAKNKQVIVCAPTGIAATVIKGTTIHRAFNLKASAAFTPKKLKIVGNRSDTDWKTSPSVRILIATG